MLLKIGKESIDSSMSVRDVIKLRNVSIPKTHHQYYMLTETVCNIYNKPELKQLSYLHLLLAEFAFVEKHRDELTDCEQSYWILLESIHPFFCYPIFTLDNNLYTTLSKTKCDVNSVVLEKCFAKQGIIFLPKSCNHSTLIFRVVDSAEIPDEKILVVCVIENQIGSIGVTYIPLSKVMHSYMTDCDILMGDDEVVEIIQLINNIFLYKQSIPDEKDVVYTSPNYVHKGFGKNVKKSVVPIVIGENHKPRSINLSHEKGTHKSPITHWRSGHWRQQPHGSRDNVEFKTIWIEPTLVNF